MRTPSVRPAPATRAKLPTRDPSKPAEQQGLFRKFVVQRADGTDQPGGKHHGCRYFVLDVDHDQHAKAALSAYADACEATHPELARDLREKWGALSHPADGWRLVPEQPTPNMLGAWYQYKNGYHFPGDPPPPDTSDVGAYKAMLAAAPLAAKTEGK